MIMAMNGYSDQPTYEYDTQDFIQPEEAVEVQHGNSLKNVESENSQKSGNKSSQQQLPFTFVRVRYDELQFHECCGQGTFGSVYRASWLTQGGKEVAVKKLNNMDKEAHVLNLLSHRNIVQFYGACVSPPNFCIVTEYAPYGSLFDFLSREESNKLEFNQLLSWARDIALGMNYLHEEAPLTIIHRDLKSKNVVICEDFVLKICDFGASRFFGDTVVMTITGTYPWMAPELIQGLPTSELCDVYSFGVVLWELLTREIPFKGLQGFQIAWAVVEREERPAIPTSCPERFSDLINRCWSSDVTKRPSFYDILGELHSMLNNEKLMESTNSFIQSKESWVKDMREKLEEMKQQEREFGAKEEELARKEEKLKEWEERLKQEMKKQTLVGTVKHHKKSENLHFNITGKGKGAIASVKDALNHVMRKSSFSKTEPCFSTFPNSEENASPFSKEDWPLSSNNDPNAREELRSTGFSSGFCPRVSTTRNSSFPTEREEPFIDSGIKFEQSETNNHLNIFSKSPFRDPGFEDKKSPSFDKTQNKFPPNKVQKQVSSSSEEYSFEGSKMSRSTNETSGGIAKEPEIQTWESAKGDAKVSKSNEKFEYEPREFEKSGTAGSTHPCFKKLKSHSSSPNLFSRINSAKKVSTNKTTPYEAPSESDILAALKSLKQHTGCQILGEDFARSLSEALKEVYASKQGSVRQSQSQNEPRFENGTTLLKPSMSLKTSFKDFEDDNTHINDNFDFSLSESSNFSKSSNSKKKRSESVFDSSCSKAFSESNGFSSMSKSFHKQESSKSKTKNQMSSSRRRSTSVNRFADKQQNETLEESSHSSCKNHQRSSRSSIINTSPLLDLPVIQKADWNGMIKPETKDKSVQITLQKLDKSPNTDSQLSLPNHLHSKSTQTNLSLIAEVKPKNSSTLQVKASPKLLPEKPNPTRQIAIAKQSVETVNRPQPNQKRCDKTIQNNTDVEISNNKNLSDVEKAKNNFDSPFYHHGSLRKRRVLPNPYRRYSSDLGAPADTLSIPKSNLEPTQSHSASVSPKQNNDNLKANPHNWKRSISTPEIRNWKNTLKCLDEDNLDSYKSAGKAVDKKEHNEKTVKVNEAQRRRNSQADVNPGNDNPLVVCLASSSADSGCSDGRCSRCNTPLHGTSTAAVTSKDVEREESKGKSRQQPEISASPSSKKRLITVRSCDNLLNLSNENSRKICLKSSSNHAIISQQPTSLSTTPERRVPNDASMKKVASGKNIKLSKQLADNTFSEHSVDKSNSHKIDGKQNSSSKIKVSTRVQRNVLSENPSKPSTKKETNLESSNSQRSLPFDGNNQLPCSFSSEIKLWKNKKPRKYVTKQAFNELDNHIVNNESTPTLQQFSTSPIQGPNHQSGIFETDDFTYIIRPKGRRIRAQI